jgi:hypothetical protein
VTLTREPTGDGGSALASAFSDFAKVVKNSLSLSAVLTADVAGAVGLLGSELGAGAGCKSPRTLLNAASRRVTPRLGAGDTGSAPTTGTAGVVDGAGNVAV